MKLPFPEPEIPVLVAFDKPLIQCYLTIPASALLEWAETDTPCHVSVDGRVFALTVREVR